MRSWYINHPQAKIDAKQDIDKLPFPYRLMAVKMKPEGGEELEKWKRMNSYVHRAIVPTYAEMGGLGEDEAKEDLQRRFACVVEYEDSYEVESIGGMSNERLSSFIESCTQFLVQNFGVIADEMLLSNINKTKSIKK